MIHKKLLVTTIIVFVGLLALGLIIISQGKSKVYPQKITLNDIAPNVTNKGIKSPAKSIFGLPVNRFQEKTGFIRHNQNLATLLEKKGIPPLTVQRLAKNSRKIFNVRYILPGKKYHLFYDNRESSRPIYFVYEKNPIDYIVFNLRNPSSVYAGKKSVDHKIEETAGVIHSSLYGTLKAHHNDPALTEKLAEVFAWEIDFYQLQKGDRYKIIYNEKTINGKTVGLGDIQATVFKHDGHSYFAFAFMQNGEKGYFDLNGNSLKKKFLKAPLKYTRISSRFSYHRFHPILHRYLPHLGVDFAAPKGTPIHAVGDGIIETISYNSGNGRYIKIRHNSVFETEYMHMSHFARGIHYGTHVTQGQVIGYVGSTGLATGPHLDYRIWKNGREVNPLTIDLPSSEPIKPEYRSSYIHQMARYISKLNHIPYEGENQKEHYAVISKQKPVDAPPRVSNDNHTAL